MEGAGNTVRGISMASLNVVPQAKLQRLTGGRALSFLGPSPSTWGAMSTPNSLKVAGHSLLLLEEGGGQPSLGRWLIKNMPSQRETQSQPPNFLHLQKPQGDGSQSTISSQFAPQAHVGGLLAKPPGLVPGLAHGRAWQEGCTSYFLTRGTFLLGYSGI